MGIKPNNLENFGSVIFLHRSFNFWTIRLHHFAPFLKLLFVWKFTRFLKNKMTPTGMLFNPVTLLEEGPYLIWECGDSEAQVLARLKHVATNRLDYQCRYKNLCTEQDRRRLIYRLQHHQTQVFRELETQWASIRLGKSI